jgi:ribosome-associated translation inhibitor RaiA
MESGLEIAFHNLPPSPAIETSIRNRVAKLERIYPRLTGCRVAVECEHKQHRTGNVCSVHIEMYVPGGKLVVSREPHHVRERLARPHLHSSLRQAFHAAEAQLKGFKAQQQGDVKARSEVFRVEEAPVLQAKSFRSA